MNEETAPANKPPYLSYTTFSNFLKGLKKGVLPARIDKSVMAGQSGSTQSYLLGALRFFRLIDANGSPQPDLNIVVHAEDEKFKTEWGRIVTAAYKPTFEGLDYERATTSLLDEKFAKHGYNGETVRKCQSFFAAAAEAGGIALPPHLKPNSRQSGPRKQRKPRSGNGGAAPSPPPEQPAAKSKSMKELLLDKFPQFDPAWTDEVKQKWFDGFQKLMQSADSP